MTDPVADTVDIDLLAEPRPVLLHEVVDELNDIATASLIENWIDETERRVWFLFEASRRGD